MPKIILHQPNGETVKYALNGKSFTVGRAPNNDIVLGGGSASNHHAVLRQTEGGEFSVTDFDSTNKTRVNGEEVQTQVLRHGDQLQFGDILAEYLSDTAAPSMAPTPPAPPREEVTAKPAKTAAAAPNVVRPQPAGGGPVLHPTTGQTTAGEGCFALFLVLLFGVLAFLGGLWLRHAKDHNQGLNEYVAEWRKEVLTLQQAPAK